MPSEWEDDEKPLSAEERSLLQKVIRSGLVPNSNSLEIQRQDPRSPLYSVKTFEELNLQPELLKGIIQMGFTAPSKIQETALPTLMADPPQNMIAQSQSGTGKTAAFLLAMLSRMDVTKKHPQAIVLVPTYELALQIGDVASRMTRYCTSLTIRYAVRGENVARGTQIEDQVIIGTPGKLRDWTSKLRVFDPKLIRVFVLDEADVMINIQGHQDQSIRIQRELDESQCQMMLFSATYVGDVMDFAMNIISNPVIIRLKREEESVDTIVQYWIDCPTPDAKFEAICNIYGYITICQAVIFCHTRKTATWLAKKMAAEGNMVAMLCGDLEIEKRIEVLDRFRDGTDKVLVTTNIMARGIDVPQVSLVVNFDMPVTVQGEADCETYLHRIGRAGRFGQRGLAINLIDGPKAAKVLQVIEEHFGRPIHVLDTTDAASLAEAEARRSA